MHAMYYAISLLVYGFMLYSSSLGGVGVFGLLFEAPIAILIRQQLACTGMGSGRARDAAGMRVSWWLTVSLFLITRGLPSVLWIVTLIPGVGLEKHLDSVELTVYYTLGAFWTCFNLWFFRLVLGWTTGASDTDLQTSPSAVSAGEFARGDSFQSASQESGKESTGEAAVVPSAESKDPGQDQDDETTQLASTAGREDSPPNDCWNQPTAPAATPASSAKRRALGKVSFLMGS